MKNRRYIYTSESVTEGHPDKICDQISDAILDAALQDDPDARVACECLTKTGVVIVAGEMTTRTYIDIPAVVRRTIREIGYDDPHYGFDCEGCGVLTSISEQSPDIAQGVDETKNHEQGAGDQGLGDRPVLQIHGNGCAQNFLPPHSRKYIPSGNAAHRTGNELAEIGSGKLCKLLRCQFMQRFGMPLQYDDHPAEPFYWICVFNKPVFAFKNCGTG